MIDETTYAAIMQEPRKLERCKRYFQALGWADTRAVWMAAADCECAASTAYRARRQLIEQGALDADLRFTGRPVAHHEVAQQFDDLPQRLDVEALAHRLYSTVTAVYYAVRAAERCGLIRPIGSTSYGLMYRKA